jgi:hypothetical protein
MLWCRTLGIGGSKSAPKKKTVVQKVDKDFFADWDDETEIETETETNNNNDNNNNDYQLKGTRETSTSPKNENISER